MALSDNLVAYYRCEDAADTDLLDAHGGFDGTITGAGVGSVAGKVGNARSFSGSEAFLMGDQTAFEFASGQAFSFSFWIKATGNTTQRGILTKGYTSVAEDNRPWYICRWNTSGVSGTLDFIFRTTGGGDTEVTVTGIGDDAWHHVVLTYDGTDMRLYVDNSEVDTALSVTADAYGTNTSQFSVGIHADVIYDGVLDEFGVWKGRGLSSSDVAALWNSGNGLSYSELIGAGELLHGIMSDLTRRHRPRAFGPARPR